MSCQGWKVQQSCPYFGVVKTTWNTMIKLKAVLTPKPKRKQNEIQMLYFLNIKLNWNKVTDSYKLFKFHTKKEMKLEAFASNSFLNQNKNVTETAITRENNFLKEPLRNNRRKFLRTIRQSYCHQTHHKPIIWITKNRTSQSETQSQSNFRKDEYYHNLMSACWLLSNSRVTQVLKLIKIPGNDEVQINEWSFSILFHC